MKVEIKFCVLFLFLAVPFEEQEINPFIVGGTAATAGQIPWQVSLRTTGNFHFCGGSIIADVRN